MAEVGLIPTTGAAKLTVEKHQTETPITLFASSFCPFVQRAWITLECTHTPYRYVEIDPYAKPKELLDVNPRGLVPGLRVDGPSDDFDLKDGQWLGIGESVVIMDLIEEIAEKRLRKSHGSQGASLLPPKDDIFNRALQRLHADYINRHLVPTFYRFLQAQTPESQAQGAVEYLQNLLHLVELLKSARDHSGPHPPKGLFYDNGSGISWTDVMVAPWLVRIQKVLRYYRGFDLDKLHRVPPKKGKDGKEEPSLGDTEQKALLDELRSYVQKVVDHELVQQTTSEDELYIKLYKRYAENRPNTSQVADAVNNGRGLP